MRIVYPKIFPFVLLIILGGLVWWLNAVSDLKIHSRKLDAHQPDLTAFDVEGIRFDRLGKPLDKLTATQLSHYHANNSVWLNDPILKRTEMSKPTLTVSSVKAQLLQNSDELFMYDKVRLTREAFIDYPALRIDTSDLFVNMGKETVHSSSPIIAVSGKNQVSAVGFDFDHRSGVLNLLGRVKVIYVKEE